MDNSFSKNQIRRLNSEEVKMLELDILKFFSSFCEDNGIQYWLDYGTLIGCIRHKGFIPWDDDIDVGMLREDYDKFVKLFSQTKSRYIFHSLETDGFKYVIGKCGELWDTNTILINNRRYGNEARECIKIDIFPYDKVPIDACLVKKFKNKERKLFALAALQNHTQEPQGSKLRKLVIKLSRRLTRLIPINYYEKSRALYRTYYSSKNANRYCFANPYDRVMQEEWISEFVKMEYEGQLFYIPIGYDSWLRENYGDYMKLPPIEKYGFIDDLYKEAIETGVINAVEPHTTTLMYAMGKKIYFALGSQNNIKITRKEDLELFEGYLLEQHRKRQELLNGEVVVFLADGFEECEGLLVVDLLRRAGLKVVMASIMGRRDVKSSREILIQADCLAENVDFDKAKMVVLPGGRLGTEKLSKSDIVIEQCKAFAENKFVAAVCAAPSILAELGLMKKATVHPDFKNHMGKVKVLDESVVVMVVLLLDRD